MQIEEIKKLSYQKIRAFYKQELQGKYMSDSTITTTLADTFYLWNHGSAELFWKTVTSNDFDNDAYTRLYNALSQDSSGNVDNLVNGYVATLNNFKNWLYASNREISLQDDYKALEEFLLDIECLDPLSEWTSKFNLFDILKITRTEIRHSNMLAWLLDPNENHGLGDSILKGFVQYAVSHYEVKSNLFSTLLMDYYSFTILREWQNIDLVAVSEEEKFVLVIENKVFSGEHDNQLNRYKALIEKYFEDYQTIYFFLSPDGIQSSEPDEWFAIGYQQVLELIENAMNKISLLPDVKLLIDNYTEIIRRDILGDEELAKICREIYKKHKKALDLIYDNKPDKASDLRDIFLKWCAEKENAGELEAVKDKCNKTYTRFKTKQMSKILPDAVTPTSGWNTANYYFYEIINKQGNEFYIQLALSGNEIPDNLRSICEEINRFYPNKIQKENWQWRIPFVTKHSRVEDSLNREKIMDLLNKKFKEIKEFECDLTQKLGI